MTNETNERRVLVRATATVSATYGEALEADRVYTVLVEPTPVVRGTMAIVQRGTKVSAIVMAHGQPFPWVLLA